MIGAKNEGRAVNQVKMASFAECRAHEKMPPKANLCRGHIRRVGSDDASPFVASLCDRAVYARERDICGREHASCAADGREPHAIDQHICIAAIVGHRHNGCR